MVLREALRGNEPIAAVLECVGDGLRRAAVEGLGRGPAVGVVDVRVGGVCGIAVLVHEVPQLLWSEVEDLWSGAVASTDGGLVKVHEWSVAGLGEVGEAHVYQAVAGSDRGTGEYMVFAVVKDDRGIFDTFDVAAVILGADQWTA